MIVNIRGTSGSGKSHIVRAVMDECAKHGEVMRHLESGRRQPLYYTMTQPNGQKLAVIGHYETPCGGCDTIPSMDKIYELVRKRADEGYNVLYEGLLLSAEVRRVVDLKEDRYSVKVIALDLPLEECVASVNQRRWAKNPDKPGVNPKNTEAKWKQTRRALDRIQEAGIEAYLLTRRDAFFQAASWLWG